jgi:pimeloyl-ACP methyl ester carboxylesterase
MNNKSFIKKLLLLFSAIGLILATFGIAANAEEKKPGSDIVCNNITTQVPSVENGAADLTMAGKLCYPSSKVPTTVQLLVHGATYNKIVWDWPQQSATYSYVQAAVAKGYATFAVDRLGSGQSTRPLSTEVTMSAGATALHGIVSQLRAGKIGGLAFQKVVWVGHSLGSVYAYEYGSRYSDIDAYILTGSVHFIKQSWFAEVQANLQPANPAGDPGYLTTAPGMRGKLFYYAPTADPAVVAQDEATKDTVTVGELQTALPLDLVPPDQSPTQLITAPILVTMGDHDNIVCGGPDGLQCTKQVLLNYEQPYFKNASRFDVVVAKDTGHMVSQHTTAPKVHAALLEWVLNVVPPRA